ncbi:MAG: gas vesicle protein K [Pseudomonadota bacterium]
MKIDLEGENLKGSLVGLVIAIVEILHETLEHQALRRMEGKSLNDEQIERLGNSLLKLKETIEELKEEQGICEAVGSLRKQLDGLVDSSIWLKKEEV